MTPEQLFAAVKHEIQSEVARPLYRLTESYNLGSVLAHGTDRAGRPDRPLDWRAYQGPPRRWNELIYATREHEAIASFGNPQQSSAFKKLGETPDAIVLVYDEDAFDWVADRQYAIKPNEDFRTALKIVLRTTPLVQRISTRSPG